jgi:peroxiredoxin
VNAQVVSVRNIIDKLESYNNFSYQSVCKQKDYTSDTTIERCRDVFLKTPGDKNFGYLFGMETLDDAAKLNFTDLYNGQNIIHITPVDSSYEIGEINAHAYQLSLLSRLNWIKSFLEKKPSKIVKGSDTIINAVACSHLIIDTYDTIVNKEHYYTRIHLFIDELSGLPDYIVYRSRNAGTGDGITNYYSENRYFNYKLNQNDMDIASMTIPKGFHLHKEEATLPLLVSGTIAPDWTLYDPDGKKMSLKQLKGKVILLDFFFIGCGGCMEALKPLNRLHEKYKNQNVAMVSITHRDNKKSVAIFKENYHIKYPVYINAVDVVKSYHVEGFPTFYFIDKDGKISNAFIGYSDDFEAKATSIIDGLLESKN